MNGSYIHIFHLIAFGLVSATLIPGIVLNRKLVAEKDLGIKMQIGGVMRIFGAFALYNVILLLITGIGNIYNRYSGTNIAWYSESWLVIKIILFAILAINGLFVAPKLMMGRMMIIKSIADKTASADAEQKLSSCDKKVSLFFLVQAVLLLAVLYLSVFGPGKHPGVF
jgi:hypothetical protein